MKNHIDKGKAGETIACQYLVQHGYNIQEQNYRHRRLEIDIIAIKDNVLIFVEVKTRKNVNYGYPEDAVSHAKAQKILAAAEAYIYTHDWQGDIRFDIIAVVLNSTPQIAHFEDAFY